MRWKRKKRNFKLSKIIVPSILLLLLISVVLVLRLNVFTVGDFEVKGESVSCTDNNQIKNAVSLKGQNFFFIDEGKTENDLKNKFFCIKSVLVSKQLPNKITLQVSGRQAAATVIDLKSKEASVSSLIANIATPSAEDFKNTYAVDEESVVFAKDLQWSNSPKIYISNLDISLGKKLEGGILNNALKILNKIKTFAVIPDQSWITDGNFLVYLTPPAPKVVFRLNSEVDYQLASLQLILTKAKIDSKEIEFIDLRFDKPVIKFAPEK